MKLIKMGRIYDFSYYCWGVGLVMMTLRAQFAYPAYRQAGAMRIAKRSIHGRDDHENQGCDDKESDHG